MRDHPIFEQFDLDVPFDEGEFHVNHVGCRTRLEYDKLMFMENYPEMRSSGAVYFRHSEGSPHLPERLSEDYYEWIDLLSAIASASDHFVSIEVGAGYGRWLANAAKALDRFRGPRIKSRFFCGVEMQDSAFDWMRQHLDVNGVAESERLMLLTGVSDVTAYELMELRPGVDYGTPVQPFPGDLLKNYYEAGTYYLKIDGVDNPYKIIKVMPLADILRELVGRAGVVDIMHVDIQGAEMRAIPAAIDVLNRQVKRMHIGTHGRDIEVELPQLLARNGWIIDRAYRGYGRTEAEFGAFHFMDGIVSCRNSRFVTG